MQGRPNYIVIAYLKKLIYGLVWGLGKDASEW